MSIVAHGVRKSEVAGEAATETADHESSPPAQPAPHGFLPVPVAGGDAVPLRRLASGDDPLGGQAAPSEVTDVLRRRSGGGAPLPEPVRSRMGEQFGADLSGVRIHNDGEAHGVAQAVQSVAFTHGRDIYFSRGSFDPGSGAGQRLLAHELAHVTSGEQGGSGSTTIGRADDPAERAADATADRIVGALRRSTAIPSGGPSPVTPLPAVLRRSAAVSSTLRRFGWPKWMPFGKGAGAAEETRSANLLYGGSLQRPAAPKDPSRRAGEREAAEASGRRKNIGTQAGAPKNIIKITTAGSAYGKWATNEAADVAPGYAPDEGKKKMFGLGDTMSKAELEAAWRREGEPNGEQWMKMEAPSRSRPVWYRKKNEDKGPEFLFPGPGGVGTVGEFGGKNKKGAAGTLDHGSNSIENVAKRALVLVGDTMGAREWEPAETRVIIRAHSRGSVAGALLATRLKRKYKNLQVEVVLFDPVPGPAQEDFYRKRNLTAMEESTVVYSIRSGYGATAGAFRPMIAKGVKRIIISAQEHSAGLVHGFNYDGKIFKGSRLNDLPSGVYVDLSTSSGGKEERDKYPLIRLPEATEPYIEKAISLAKDANGKMGDLMRPNKLRSALGAMQ